MGVARLIQAQQQRSAREQMTETLQEYNGFVRAEVAQRTPWEKADAALLIQQWMGRQIIEHAVVAADAEHRRGWMARRQSTQRFGQCAAADIQRHKGRGAERSEQGIHLACIADAEFEHHSITHLCGNGRGIVLEQPDFGPGQGVLGLLADLGEQP